MDIQKYERAAAAVDPSFAHAARALAAVGELTANAAINVTAIRDEAGVLSKHIVDSLYAAREIASLDARSVLDVGSGGGFPALPIAAVLPDVAVTALDSTAKKCRHIESVAAAAGISNVSVICGRAEESTELFGGFEIVISRAVASLGALLELTSPHCAVGGHVLAMKGERADDESHEAARAVEILGLEQCEGVTYALPEGGDHRTILIYRKVRPTPPGYPRKWGAIKKGI